jgi:uncharacterized protein YqhQ
MLSILYVLISGIALPVGGMQMQYLSTREPDDSMIECAIAAFTKVIPEEDK